MKKLIKEIKDLLLQLKTRRDWKSIEEVDAHIDDIILLTSKLDKEK